MNDWGGKRKGAGRKKLPENEKIVYIRKTVIAKPDEWERIKQNAIKANKTLSRYLVDLGINN